MRPILLALLLPALALAEEAPSAQPAEATAAAPAAETTATAATAAGDPAAAATDAAGAPADPAATAAPATGADAAAAAPAPQASEAAALDPASEAAPVAASADGGAPSAATAAPADAAALPAPPPPPVADAPLAAPRAREWPRFGVAWHLGFPEFGVLGLVYRPWGWLRATAGASYNYVGMGLHGEVSLAPFRWYLTPSLNLSGGKYLRMSASKISAVPEELEGLADDLDYSYLSAMLGLEFGNQRHGIFFLHAGAARVSFGAKGTATFESDEDDPAATPTTVEVSGVSVRSFVPAVKIGWIIFL